MEALFEELRKRCSPAVWSRGVELTRIDAVSGVRAEGDEVELRVATKGGLICPTVKLFLDDADWECSCGERVCEHAAAAAIALRRAREAGDELPRPAAAVGHVGYRFSRAAGMLALQRVVARKGAEQPLETTLASAVAGRAGAPPLVASAEDLSIELVLGTHRRGPVPRGLWAKLLPLLARCADVQLDGKPLRVSRDPVGPIGLLEDQGDGFRLTVRDDPAVTEILQNGVALCGDVLRPVAEMTLTGRELHELPAGKHFGADAVAELVTEVLPSLRARIPVEIATARLPVTSGEKPRIALDVQRQGTTLSALATLVYGDPPRARVDAGRLVPLGSGPIPLRDVPGEHQLSRRLRSGLGLAPGVRVDFEGEEAVAFAARLRTWEGPIRGAAHEWFRRVAPIAPRVVVDGERFDVFFEAPLPGAAGGRGRADAGAVLHAWREGASLVPLLEGGWAPLPGDWLARHGHLVADLLAARDEAGRVPRCAAPDLARLCDDLDIALPAGLDQLRRIAESFEEVPEARLPVDLTATLRPYQREGVNRLAFLRLMGLGAMLADDMGLGKTVQALCAIEGRTLVVCPTSVLHNWVDEIRRFRPGLSYAVYHGPKRALDASAAVTLTTYALLRSDEDALAAQAWDAVVLDEAQNIKNPRSQVTGAAWRLPARFRVTLTGTPVENRLDELWSQFWFLNRGLLGSLQDFEERYARPIADGEGGAAERLRARIRPFVVRRLKRDVAPELPPRSDAVLYCALEPEERALYEAVHAATLPAVVARLQEGGSVIAALEALLRLRQAACHPALIPGGNAATFSKVVRLLEVLDTVVADGHKALVFSQWTALLDLIEPHLRAATLDFVRLDGSTRDRGEVVGRFQAEGGPPVMLVSLKAGGTGLNLTAADHVFLMDPWWNPAVEDQAADRAHRIGQDRPVLVYRLVAEETVEEKILALQESKRFLADAALGGGTHGGALTRDDILALLE